MLQKRTEDPITLQEGREVYIQHFRLIGMFLEKRKKKIRLLVPIAMTLSAMTASCKLHRRALPGNSPQEPMFLQKEGTRLEAALWPQQ